MKIFLQLFLFTLLFCPQLKAEWGFEGQGFYQSGTQDAGTDSEMAGTFWQGAFLVDLTKNLFMGWSYGSVSLDEKVGTTKNKLETQDMGIAVRYFLGSRRNYMFSVNYNILATASQSNGTTQEDWTGTSYLASFAATPEMGERLRLGIQINYYNADYTSKTVGSTKTTVTYNKNWLFPALLLIKTF